MGCERLEPKQVLAVNLLTPIADLSLPAGPVHALDVRLADRFVVPDVVGTVVKVQTNANLPNPTFLIELFNTASAAPVRATTATANGFLAYVDDGSFDRTIVHRSVPGFVIQGGGFTAPAATHGQPGGSPTPLTVKGSLADEIGNPNQRGTVAMAKVSGGLGAIPNSATSQWFVNLGNNASLDAEFTAFGRVLGTGMAVVDALAAVRPYDVRQYYGNSALGELPLWDVPDDGLLRPADFVTIERMSRAAPADLLAFSVTTSNPNLVRAEVRDGSVVLSRAGAAAGTVTVTVRASAAFDPNDFHEHSFQVTVPQFTSGTLEATGSVTLAVDAAGILRANGTAITSGGAGVDIFSLGRGGWTALAAEAIAGVNTVLLRNSTGALHFWRMDAGWKPVSGDGWVTPDSLEFFTTETAFSFDIDGDGMVGLTMIEDAGSMTLAHDGARNLRVNGTPITVNGVPFKHTSDQNATWRGVAADVDGGVNTLVLRHSSGHLHFLRMDGGWRQLSGDGWIAPGSGSFHAAELAFGTDLDGDGVVMVEAAGDVSFAYLAGGLPTSRGSLVANGVPVLFNGQPVKYASMVAGGWTPMAAEADQGVNTVVLRHSSGNIHFWRMDADWRQASGDGWVAPASDDLYASEVTFGVDLDGDGALTIETAGSVIFAYDRDGNIQANGRTVIFNGGPMNYQQMVAAGWRPMAADVHGGANTVVLRHASGHVHFWLMDDDWQADGRGEGWIPIGSRDFHAAEATFGADLAGDGVRTIEARGSVVLTYDRMGRMRVQQATAGAVDPATTFVMFNGLPANYHGARAAGWLVMAAERHDDQNTVLLKHTSGPLHFWRMDATWRQVGGDDWITPDSPRYVETETHFGVDLNGNSSVGA